MRLPESVTTGGEWITRGKTLRFRFEGRAYEGLEGDTIASALWANGVKVLGRSFKYHRPRGILSAANHDVNAMMQSGSVPNVRADATLLVAGMDLTAVNTFSSLDKDAASILGRFARFLPVGFYYKAFHSKRLFPLWEKLVPLYHRSGQGRCQCAAPAHAQALTVSAMCWWWAEASPG